MPHSDVVVLIMAHFVHESAGYFSTSKVVGGVSSNIFGKQGQRRVQLVGEHLARLPALIAPVEGPEIAESSDIRVPFASCPRVHEWFSVSPMYSNFFRVDSEPFKGFHVVRRKTKLFLGGAASSEFVRLVSCSEKVSPVWIGSSPSRAKAW